MLTFSISVVSCGSLSTPSNGAKLGSGVTYGSVVTFRCNSGYDIEGSDSRTCQADGSWNGNNTLCRGKKCILIVISQKTRE